MADSHWQSVDRETHRRYEERYDDGDPPIDGMGPPEEHEKTIPPDAGPNDAAIDIEMTSYTNVTCAPGPDWVLEECNKCDDGHTHQVKVLFGPVVGTPPGGIQGPDVEDQQHADDEHFGEHLGERYVNSRCRGEEITRSVLTWRVGGRRIVSWKSRTVDHVKNGFVWLSDISSNPCKDAEKLGQYLEGDMFDRGGEQSRES